MQEHDHAVPSRAETPSRNEIPIESRSPSDPPFSRSRRDFLEGVGGLTTAVMAATTLGLEPLLGSRGSVAYAREIGPLTGEQRRDRSFDIRVDAARFNAQLPIPPHPCNGDEDLFANKIGTYTKGLVHTSPRGEVDRASFVGMINALTSGRPADFEAIALGCPDPSRQRRLVNPQAGLGFDLEGTDSHQFTVRAAPAFSSAEEAGESVENYWMALLRDVNFNDYDHDRDARAAASDLSRLSDFRGPKKGGRVTTGTLFRDDLPGTLTGPYISQFLLKGTPFGAEYVVRQMRTTLPNIDYMTNFNDWLDVQRGCRPAQSDQFDPVRRFIRNGRDLGQWVHVDVLFQAYFNACLILLTPPDPSDPVTGGGIGAPLNPGNPYNRSRTQDGFGTFGGPYIKTILCEVSTRALKSVWYQKWFVHRRLRPEAFGGRVHLRATNQANYPIHADVLNSQALARTFSRFGAGFLPMAFPEGSPLHPAYGAGHATVAGACVTILKAMFDETFVIPDPVVASADGLSLEPLSGSSVTVDGVLASSAPLTVGGELNKLASNIATGRNLAGVHWRTDGIESLKLGEAVAISLLRDQRATYNEAFAGFTFTKFDGTTITI